MLHSSSDGPELRWQRGHASIGFDVLLMVHAFLRRGFEPTAVSMASNERQPPLESVQIALATSARRAFRTLVGRLLWGRR